MKTLFTLMAVFVAAVSFAQTSAIVSDGIDGISRTIRTGQSDCVAENGRVMRLSMTCVRVNDSETWAINVDFITDTPFSMSEKDIMLLKNSDGEVIELAQTMSNVLTADFGRVQTGRNSSSYIIRGNYLVGKDQVAKISRGITKIRVSKSTGKEDFTYNRDEFAVAVTDAYQAINFAIMETKDIRVGF